MFLPFGYSNVTMVFSVAGSPRDITWSFGLDTTDQPTDNPVEFADIVYDISTDTLGPYIPGQMATGWTFQGVSVSKQFTLGPIVGTHIEPVAGTVSVSPLPVNCTLLLSKRTGLGGKQGRGRAYLPPCHLSEADINAVGDITADITGLRSRYDFLFDTLVTGGYNPVLFHAGAEPAPSVITSTRIEDRIATQRRRMRS